MLICLQKEQVWFQDLQVACGELWFSETIYRISGVQFFISLSFYTTRELKYMNDFYSDVNTCFINHVTTHEIEGNHYKVTKLIFINSNKFCNSQFL